MTQPRSKELGPVATQVSLSLVFCVTCLAGGAYLIATRGRSTPPFFGVSREMAWGVPAILFGISFALAGALVGVCRNKVAAGLYCLGNFIGLIVVYGLLFLAACIEGSSGPVLFILLGFPALCLQEALKAQNRLAAQAGPPA